MPDPDYSDLFPGLSPDQTNQLITNSLKKNLSSTDQTVPDTKTSDRTDYGLLPYAVGAAAPGAVKLGAAAAAKLGASLAGKAGLAAKMATFGGPFAKFANKRKLESFEGSSTTPERAYDSTGWFRDAHGNPRFEISDKGMSTKEMPTPLYGVSHGTVEDFIDHPKLFSNYPGAKRVGLKIDPDYGTSDEALFSYDTDPPYITIGGPVGKHLDTRQQASLLHELGGHYVDRSEGFPYGAGINEPFNHIRDLLLAGTNKLDLAGIPKTDPSAKALFDVGKGIKGKGFQMYKSIPSETSARNISDRFFMEKYGLPTASEWGPQTNDINHVIGQFKEQGLNLQPRFDVQYKENQYPSHYDIFSSKNPRYLVKSENLPKELRSLYDRLPYESGHRYPLMAGEFKYPWKTEDLPRSHQMDWLGINNLEDIPENWIKALKTMR